MKQVTIEKKDFITRYEAIDGQRFSSKEECAKYEGTCLCVLKAKVKDIALKVMEGGDILGGSCDNRVYTLVPRNDADVVAIQQLYVLCNGCGGTVPPTVKKGQLYMLVIGYDSDWASLAELSKVVESYTNGRFTVTVPSEEDEEE